MRFNEFLRMNEIFNSQLLPTEVDFQKRKDTDVEKRYSFVFERKNPLRYLVIFERYQQMAIVGWAVKFRIDHPTSDFVTMVNDLSAKEVKDLFSQIYYIVINVMREHNFKTLFFVGSTDKRVKFYQKILGKIIAKQLNWRMIVRSGKIMITFDDRIFETEEFRFFEMLDFVCD